MKTAVAEAANDVVVNLSPDADSTTNRISIQPSHDGSPQPTILPANALRLHLDDPSAPLTDPVDLLATTNADPRPSRVRFRSRVRITSGFSHHRQRSDSGSCSPSSSISAPLRSQPHDSTNTWGTLGQRVGLLALQKKIMGSSKTRRMQTQGLIVPTINVNEHTPLRNSFNQLPYVEREGVQDGDILDEDSDDERLSQELNDVFGKFPGRLLNPHWWYWQLEPIICCCFTGELE